MGNAFFTQTATTKDKETVIFHLPYYGRNEVAGRPLVRLAPGRNIRGLSADMITVIPDSTASKNIRYSYGRDGMKWTTNDSVAQLYMLDSKRLTRISLLGAAPTEVDIPLGVNIPAEDNFIFSLPDKARVYLDNDYRGETPLELDGLKAGQHRLRVEKAGFDPMARNVTLARGAKATEEFRPIAP